MSWTSRWFWHRSQTMQGIILDKCWEPSWCGQQVVGNPRGNICLRRQITCRLQWGTHVWRESWWWSFYLDQRRILCRVWWVLRFVLSSRAAAQFCPTIAVCCTAPWASSGGKEHRMSGFQQSRTRRCCQCNILGVWVHVWILRSTSLRTWRIARFFGIHDSRNCYTGRHSVHRWR